jgi:predicted ATPase/DNA-binding SARP family transcriptional activator
MVMQTLQLLGPVRVKWNTGVPPRFRSQRTMALLGYLAAERRAIARKTLEALFWPDEVAAAGQANLRRELHNLGQILPGCWRIDSTAVQFAPGAYTQVDIYVLRHLIEHEQWPEAAALLGGEFLEGVLLDDNPEFESWLLGEQERRRQTAERVLTRAAQAKIEQGNPESALRYLRRLLQIAPWDEEAHRHLMRLLALNGQFSAALRQYEQCRAVLAAELDVPPAPATKALYERIKTAQALPPSNLPPQATLFIGREAEVAALQRLLSDPDCRLLTLTGVGADKSRLALQVAHRSAVGDFRLFLHGAAYVPLAGVERQDLLPAIAAALGLAFSGPEPVEGQLFHYLRDMKMLLLLDNYEHLLPETVLLAAILREAPAVKLLVTSRERLKLPEERVFDVDGLPYREVKTSIVVEGTIAGDQHPVDPPEAPRFAGKPRHNLPLQLSSFIGREREVTEISRLLESSRLVTVTGVGGSGKTRLAVESAKGSLESFPDGVWFIEFAPLSDPMLAPSVVASTIGLIKEHDRSIADALVSYLRDRKVVLLLDNCEHLIEVVAQLAETLLRSCPDLHVLSTSRERFDIDGEVV